MKRSTITVVCSACCLTSLWVFAAAPGPATQASLPPSPLAGLNDDAPFVLLADETIPHYDPAIATPESLLGFGVGTRAAMHAEIERCLKAWDGKGAGGARARLFQHGKTWEGRNLYHIVISSAANLARLDAIMLGLQTLADPRGTSVARTTELSASLPAVAWLGFSIHGDETSGADAAVQLAYHLIASTDPETTELLDKTLIVIDPMMNPDGRDRFLKMIAEHRAAQPSVDDQSLLHEGYWPAGRWNHYWFDMNRDWIYATQPETRGRIAAIRRFNPLLFVDAHEMGSQDTYLFAPSREPFNPNHPQSRQKWNEVFAADQARAFDARGWTYYTGEWNEGWYPGYSDSYSAFRGAVGVLYEQARYAEDGVRQRTGRIATYREAVRHQLTSARANLATLAAHKDEMLREYAAERRALAEGSNTTYAKRAWAIEAATLNPGRRLALRNLLALHGVEVKLAAAPFTATAIDRVGVRSARRFESGTWVVPGAQPEALLAAVMFEFDPRMPASFLESERREILRTGQSRLYDITAWNLPMVMDLPAFTLEGMPAGSWRELPDEVTPPPPAASTVGWIADGNDDRAPALAARLMERGVVVRVSIKATELSGKWRPRGSVVVTKADNVDFSGLPATLREVAGQLGIGAEALSTGLGPGSENSDLGSAQFPALQPPRIAIVTRGNADASAGEAWFQIDQRLGVRATLLDADSFDQVDLRRYNVIVFPNTYGENPALHSKDALKAWISAGGTLIAMGQSAAQWAGKEGGLEAVRTLSDAWDNIVDFEQAVLREAIAPNATVDVEKIYARGVASGSEFPWNDTAARPELPELKRRDAWQSLFMPGGVELAARVDDRHWLTAGCGAMLPVLMHGGTALVTKSPAQAPVRFGVLTPEPASAAKAAARAPVGWSALPAGQTVTLRLAGLLWPEAAARLANAAFVAREADGAGQSILFADSPVFRGSMYGTARLFLNAVVYGPGLGAQATIQP